MNVRIGDLNEYKWSLQFIKDAWATARKVWKIQSWMGIQTLTQKTSKC